MKTTGLKLESCYACGNQLRQVKGTNSYECSNCGIDLELANGLLQFSLKKCIVSVRKGNRKS